MSRPFFRSPLARVLILALAVTSLAAYVVNVSCSRPAPSTTPAVAPYMPDAAARDASAASAAKPQGDPSGDEPETLPPGLNDAPQRRFYGHATKSGFAIHGPRPAQQEAKPTNQAPNQVPKKPPARFYGPASKSDIVLSKERAKEEALRSGLGELIK